MAPLVDQVICPNVEWKVKNPFKARRFCGAKKQEDVFTAQPAHYVNVLVSDE